MAGKEMPARVPARPAAGATGEANTVAIPTVSPFANVNNPHLAAERFFEALHGEDAPGNFNLWTGEDKKARWFLTRDRARAASEAMKLAPSMNVYCSVGIHGQQLAAKSRGKADNIVGIPGFWAEIDVLDPAHKETDLPPTRADALSLVYEFPLPPTLVVWSGHGLQGYWLFKELWTFETDEERRQAADLEERFILKFKKLADGHGWEVDSVQDLARVLRVPGTWNRKKGLGPVRVEMIEYHPERRYNPSDFEAYLPDAEPRPERRQRSAQEGNLPAPPINSLVAGCAWLRERREKAAIDPEPQWYGMLTIVGRCQNGEELAHEWSEPYPDYDWEETDRKLAHALRDTGPLTCRYIRDNLDAEKHCSTCEVWGKATSPMIFGHAPSAKPSSNGTAPDVPCLPQPEAYHRTDLGNARRLVALHSKSLRYCHPEKQWYSYDGRRWQQDNRGEAERRAKATVATIYAEAAAATDDTERKNLAKHALASEGAQRIRSMLALAESEPGIPILPAEMDADPWLLNCLNGTVDLRTGELRPHNPEDLLTKLAPVEYDGHASLELWDRFLAESTGGDIELAGFLQRAVGYSLTGLTTEEVLLFVHGPTAAGKSTFLEATKSHLGDYAATADFDTFLHRRDVATARPDIARLARARMVTSIEVDQGKKLAEGLIKTLTGGDTVTARHLYQKAFEFEPSFKLWLAANHAPAVDDDDDAIWRRILRIPFEHTVPEERRDPAVKQTLKDTQVAGPAMLAWAVQGCIEWQQQGLGVPPAVKRATAKLRQEMDPLKDFLEEYCVLDKQAFVEASKLREAYETWCKENGEKRPIGGKTWGAKLRTHDCMPSQNSGGTRIWKGVRLRGPGEGPPSEAGVCAESQRCAELNGKMQDFQAAGELRVDLRNQPHIPHIPHIPHNDTDSTGEFLL